MQRPCQHKPQDFLLLSDKNKSPSTLTSVQYQCQIINNILKTTLVQTFVSNNEYSESTYYFPITEEVCLESFVAKYNDKTIKGIVKEKLEAQKQYQENKDQGNLVSYAQTSTIDDSDFCLIKLGNLPPNQQVEIVLVFSQQLNSFLNKYYLAQIPLLCCQDEISAKLGKSFFTLDLFCTGRINYAEMEGYPTNKNIIDSNTVRFNINKACTEKKLNLYLLFSFEGMFEPQVIFGSSQIFSEDQVKRAILPVSNSVMVSFIPNFNEKVNFKLDDSLRAAFSKGDYIFSDEFQQKLNQDVVNHLDSSKSEFIFLLDRSGSMSGKPIQTACAALILFLKSLPSDSFFNVISFGSTFQMMSPSPIKYNSNNLNMYIPIIKQFSADLGGTSIYQPLESLFQSQRISGYNRQIFLLTDGEVDSPKQVVNLIKKNNKYCRVHCIGFGYGADKYLIKEGSKAGKGISKIVDSQCDLSQIIIEMLTMCITPTLDDFQIKYDKNVFSSIYPSINQFPCIFKDEIINIHLFFKAPLGYQNLTEEQKKIEIEYYDSHKKSKVKKQIKLEMQDCFTCNPELQQSVFKIGKQLFLNENILSNNLEDSTLVQQSVDYQLLTDKTALICVIQTLNDEQKVIYENVKFSQQKEKEQLQQYDQSHILKSYQNISTYPKVQSRNSGKFTFCWSSNQPEQPRSIHISNLLDDDDDDNNHMRQQQQQLSSLDLFSSCAFESTQIQKNNQQFQNYNQQSYSTNQNNSKEIKQPIDLLDLYDNSNVQQQSKNQKLQDQNSLPQIGNQNNFQSTKNPINLLDLYEKSKQNKDSQYQYNQSHQTNQNYYQQINKPFEQLEMKENKNTQQTNKNPNQFINNSWGLNGIPENKSTQKSILKLGDLLDQVNSEGMWRFDENLIKQYFKIDPNYIKQLCYYFNSNDAFMTLIIMMYIELNYNEQKSKWVLITKKSSLYIQSQLKLGVDLKLIQEKIKQFISL